MTLVRFSTLLAGFCACGPSAVVVQEPTPPSVPAMQARPDLRSTYRKHATAVVFVRARRLTTTQEGGQNSTTTTVNYGAGILLADGRVLTACHVLRFEPRDSVAPDDIVIHIGASDDRYGMVRHGPASPVTELRCDKEKDLALLRVSGEFAPRATIELAETDPSPGDETFALGPSPQGFGWTIRGCVVAGLGVLGDDSSEMLGSATAEGAAQMRTELAESSRNIVIQPACADYPMSGSPLLDAAGRLIGVHQFTRWSKKGAVPREQHFFLTVSEIRKFLAE